MIDLFGKKKNAELNKKIDYLTTENSNLKRKLDIRSSIEYSLESIIPKEHTQRRNFMKDVAGFYGIIFRKQLALMKSQQLEFLSMINLTKVEEDIYRSNINCLHLIDEWFEKCTNEHFSDLNSVKQELESENNITNLKDKYGYI